MSGTNAAEPVASPVQAGAITNPVVPTDKNGQSLFTSTNPGVISGSFTPAANQRVNTQAGDIAAGSFVAGSILDGADTTQGTTTQAKATDATTTSWSVIQLLKGILNSLLTSIAVTVASLPLPSGASTSAKQPALGTAG